MLLSIRNKPGVNALEFLKTQKNLPLVFLVSKTLSESTIEVYEEDSEYLMNLLDAKGFDYEEQEEEIKAKAETKKTKRLKKNFNFPSPQTYPDQTFGPWPF